MIKYFYNFKRWMNYNPPTALTRNGWDNFNEEFKEMAPIRYYLTEGFNYKYIRPVIRRIDSIKEFFRYRITDRYHVLYTGEKPGWHSTSNQMLFVNFNILKNIVECTCARRQRWSSDTYIKSMAEEYMPFYRVFNPIRSREMGMKYLDWECGLDDPSLPTYEQSPIQAADAREIRLLYIWWVDIRPLRKINYEIEFMHRLDEIAKHADEDDEMLIRLMKIRNRLSD